MENKVEHVIIDAGNTFIKIAHVLNGQIAVIHRVNSIDSIKNQNLNQDLFNLKGIISSVLSNDETLLLQSIFPKTVVLTREFKLPIELNYESPETLGIDRICNAAYIWNKNKNRGSVCIDIGSCIKFDFVDKTGTYQGGSISPGIMLRYKSMNDYTANLPLLDQRSFPELIGKSTIGSMHAGVIQGIHAEIFEFIQRYLKIDKDLTFFMTGGDAKYFDFHSKNNIFAVENLTLEGLYQIFLFNDQ